MAPSSVALTDDTAASRVAGTAGVPHDGTGWVGTEQRASGLYNVGGPPARTVAVGSSWNAFNKNNVFINYYMQVEEIWVITRPNFVELLFCFNVGCTFFNSNVSYFTESVWPVRNMTCPHLEKNYLPRVTVQIIQHTSEAETNCTKTKALAF